MDRMIYLSMSGAKAAIQRQDTLANNLANVSTTGFRAELQAFRAVPCRAAARTPIYTLETTVGYDDSPGQVAATGRPLGIAVRGGSWLAVQALDGPKGLHAAGAGRERRRHAGDALGPAGDGRRRADQLPPNSEASIAADGTVNVRGPTSAIGVAGKVKLVTPEQRLVRGDDGPVPRGRRRRALDADNSPASRRALEGSNVSPVENMVAMIAAARRFEAQMKLMQTAEADEAAARLLAATEPRAPRALRYGFWSQSEASAMATDCRVVS